MAATPLSLAADFPAATDAQWLKLVEKVLAGADFDKKLVARTYDGLSIKPLYTRADWRADGDASGLPGGAPYTRGSTALGNTLSGWDIRQAHGSADAAQTKGGADAVAVNKAILEDLERGVTSILLRSNGANLDRVLQGVMLDLAPVALDGAALPAAEALMKLVKARGQQKDFAGCFGLDDLGSGVTDIAGLGAAAAGIARDFPKARAFNVRGTVYHAAGAADAQELGAAVATALAYLRAMTAAGMSIDAACGQIAFTLAADADFFLCIAKFRALRKLWARVTEVCGAETRTAPVFACTATRMISRRDPWVNVLRTTVACFAAGVAGADAVTVLPFDGSDLARRVARNTQIVLQEEASLAKVVDPAGGAWMFERLTEDLADKAWTFFQEIERAGGMAKALPLVAEKIAAVQAERAKNIARRKDAITGVSEFPNVNEADPGPPVEAPGAGLKPVRLAEGFERLRDQSDAFKAKTGQRPRVFLANLGSVADFTARATFAKNFFEAGGIEAVAGAGGGDPADMARGLRQSGAPFAIICGTDAGYGESAAAIAKALKDAGAKTVYLAGRPGELEAALTAAGVDEFIFMGGDVLGTLMRAHAKLGVPS